MIKCSISSCAAHFGPEIECELAWQACSTGECVAHFSRPDSGDDVWAVVSRKIGTIQRRLAAVIFIALCTIATKQQLHRRAERPWCNGARRLTDAWSQAAPAPRAGASSWSSSPSYLASAVLASARSHSPILQVRFHLWLWSHHLPSAWPGRLRARVNFSGPYVALTGGLTSCVLLELAP